jgi:hypothetical protein
MLGRHPRATEFFAWRAGFAPDLPCHATVYRAFPGGWASVLAAVETDAPLAPGEPAQPLAQPDHMASSSGVQLARVPDVQPRAADQLGHEGVAGHEIATWQRQ